MRSIEVSVGRQTKLDDGNIIDVVEKDPVPFVLNPSGSAIHESCHINADPEIVDGATINSSAEYSAATFIKKYSRKSAGAALHLSGHSHDEMMIISHGDSPSEAAAEARNALANKGKHIHAVASALDLEKSISGNRARQIIDQVTYGETVEITITHPDGNKEIQTESGVKGEILIVNFMQNSDHFKSNEENQEDNLILFPNRSNHPGELDEAA